MEGRGLKKGICYSQLPRGTGLGGWELENASLDGLCQIHWMVMGWNLEDDMSFLHLHSQHCLRSNHCHHLQSYLPLTQCHSLWSLPHCPTPGVQGSVLDHQSSEMGFQLLQARGEENHIQILNHTRPQLRMIVRLLPSHHNLSQLQQC